MKDGLNPAAIDRILHSFSTSGSGFDAAGFRKRALAGLDQLELKQRVEHITNALAHSLPTAWADALPLVLRAGSQFPPGQPGDSLAGFAAWPVIQWVPRAGLAHPGDALDALRQLTVLFTAEFALRPFLCQFPELTLERLRIWAGDPDWRVRRLVSEGSRPRLPWGERLRELQRDPSPMLPLLERLHDDPEDNVRRSVANHLNDISKDHPGLAVELCRQWYTQSGESSLKRHALRSLIKAGDRSALALVGVGAALDVRLVAFSLDTPRIRLGEALEFSFTLEGQDQELELDYALIFPGSRGQERRKVFKLSRGHLSKGRSRSWQRSHPLKSITTRRYYPGPCSLELILNGSVVHRVGFQLEIPELA
ncbi:MAG: DNA alkylation repair protein [Candidatus Cloacimonetes bacterium]|nr:DNA alkylation repair protein [Candidatus Cloacimonadota bacterium]